MYIQRILRRILTLLAVIWAAATLNFFLPQLAPKNPITEKLTQLAETSGISGNQIAVLTEAFNERFGLDQPLWKRYFDYLHDIATFDFGYSISSYPTRVGDLIGGALPWTLGLMITTTLVSFAIGTLVGAYAAWRRDSLLMQAVSSVLMVFSAIPFYLIGLVLIYFLAAKGGWFPISGGYSLFSIPGWNWSFALEVLHHSLLPALSIAIASIGIWAIGMRGMMVTVQGEDYMVFAKAKGLKPRRVFLRYGVRNAVLPQVTTLALFFGQVVTGAVLVEIVFGYPGMGNLLLESITLFDYPTIYGIVFILIVTIALSMLLVDLIYPLIDPRVRA
ncbi:ABC transporter permease [Oceaniglobus trochenteri]|uniref:ABC transporter permease n=1 Tax=Oceaniglobus trochenteri TaxID=2763260 RepID=UPI001CFF9043|nr:ABC transporter permease [Oceaniglobus trochenteri]